MAPCNGAQHDISTQQQGIASYSDSLSPPQRLGLPSAFFIVACLIVSCRLADGRRASVGPVWTTHLSQQTPPLCASRGRPRERAGAGGGGICRLSVQPGSPAGLGRTLKCSAEMCMFSWRLLELSAAVLRPTSRGVWLQSSDPDTLCRPPEPDPPPPADRPPPPPHVRACLRAPCRLTRSQSAGQLFSALPAPLSVRGAVGPWSVGGPVSGQRPDCSTRQPEAPVCST